MIEAISKVLLITDLDGTLLPSSKILSQTDLAAISKFTGAGGHFSIATGRPFQSVKHYFKELYFTCPIILYNGSLIYDVNKNKIVWKNELLIDTRAIVEKVLKTFPSVAAEILTFNDVYAIQKNDVEQYHINITRTKPIECTLDEVPDGWLKFLFALEPDLIPELKEFINVNNFKEIEFVQSCRHFYEGLPKGTSKGSALKKLKNLCNYEDYTIIAVGDFNNDIEMLKYADIGIATGNANQDVKDIADIVLEESCNENAISKVIEYIFSQIEVTNNI